MATNKSTLWRCQNYGNCDSADESTPLELELGADFKCPECSGTEGIRVSPGKNGIPVKKLVLILGGLVFLFLIIKLLTPPEIKKGEIIIGPEEEVPIEDLRTAIDRQILARPDSEIFEKPDGSSTDRKPKNFERFFVFTKQDDWIEVGESRQHPLGWMKSADTVDWPHSIVVEYGPMDQRYPVLFFKEPGELESLLDDPARSEKVTSYYTEIEASAQAGKPAPADFPIVCMEPNHQVQGLNINPVLESKFVELDDKRIRMLRLTTAGDERGETRFDSPEYMKLLKENMDARRGILSAGVDSVDLDLVFVVDMTGSMQPWIDGLRGAIHEISKEIQGAIGLKTKVKLGLWGYQDDPGYRGIQFLTKNFTDELLNAREFSQVLDGLKVNKRTPDSYPEDVFAGVTTAITESKWRTDAAKCIVLIGDAPGHSSGDDHSSTGLNASQVYQIANDSGVQVVSLSILDSSDKDFIPYHSELQKQFKTVSQNGNGESAHLTIKSTAKGEFRTQMDKLVGELITQRSLKDSAPPATSDPAELIARSILENAKARIIATEVDEEGALVYPRDIEGWVVDHDLITPEIRSLEPKLLVNRSELGQLSSTAEKIIREAEDVIIIGGDFYDSLLRAVAGSASGGRSDRLKERLPEFIKGLPYKSEFMEKTSTWWASASAAETGRFIREMKAKLSYYRTVNENPSLWRRLNRDAASSDDVAAIPLSQLL